MPAHLEPVDLDTVPSDHDVWNRKAGQVSEACRALARLVSSHRAVALDDDGALRFLPHLDVGLAMQRAFSNGTTRLMHSPHSTWVVRSPWGAIMAWDDGQGARLHPSPFLVSEKGRLAPWAVSTALRLAPPRPVSLTYNAPDMPLWALPVESHQHPPHTTSALIDGLAKGLAVACPHLAQNTTPWIGIKTPQVRLFHVHPARPSCSGRVAFSQDGVFNGAPYGAAIATRFAAALDALRAAGRIGRHDLARAPHAVDIGMTFYIHVMPDASAHQRLQWASIWTEACALAGVDPVIA